MLELCRTVDHCSRIVSCLDSSSVVDVVGRWLFHYGPYTTSVINLMHFKEMILHIHHCRKAYMKIIKDIHELVTVHNDN